MFNKFFILLFVIELVFLTDMYTQNSIECLARVKKDNILLCWVPASIPVWQTGNFFGYNIYLYTLVRDGNPAKNGFTKGTLLTKEPVKSCTETQLDQLSEKYPESEIFTKTGYGKEFRLSDAEQGVTGFLKSYRGMETRFGLSLFVRNLSTEIAETVRVWFADPNLKRGERYTYRIVHVVQPEGLEIFPEGVIVDVGKPDIVPAPDEVKALFSEKQFLFNRSVNQIRINPAFNLMAKIMECSCRQQGRALWVCAKISTPPCGRVVFFRKTLHPGEHSIGMKP